VAVKLDFFTPSEYHVNLAMSMTSVTGSLMTFFVVFYNGNVFARYNQLYDLTKGLNENALYVIAILSREFGATDLAMVRKLARLLVASAFIFFFERTN